MNGMGDVIRISRIKEETGDSLLHQARMIADRARQDGPPASQGLTDRIGQPLIERRVNQGIVRAEEFGDILAFSQPCPLLA